MSDDCLTGKQVDAFRQTGFVIVRELFTPQEMREMAAWTDELQSWPETPGKHMMYFEKSAENRQRILNRMENFIPYHESFRQLCMGRRMAGAVAQLFGEPACTF